MTVGGVDIQQRIDEVEVDRAIMGKSFRDFVPDAFEVLERGDAWFEVVKRGRHKARFTAGWHIDAMADHLEAVARGHIKRLLINVPPDTSKSMVCCVLWPVWMWATLDERMRTLFSSYSEEFTKRDARKSRELIRTAWFQARWPHIQIAAQPETQMEYHLTAGGERHGASTNSGVTGKHVHGIVEDDPLKAQDATSERARKEVWDYRTGALETRLLPEAGWRVLVMQRLHEDDPSGRILERQARARLDDGHQYVHLRLPMEFESKFRCRTSLPFEDPRTEEGELLWPARLTPAYVAAMKGPNGLGAENYAGQAQQRPAPLGGGIIKSNWWRHYQAPPAQFQRIVMSWDMTFKKTGRSWVVGQVWGRAGASVYLLDQHREHMEFTEAVAAVVAMCNKWPHVAEKLIEDKANGPAIVSLLGAKVPGLIEVAPRGSKVERLSSVAPFFEAGNVYLPMVEAEPWVDAYKVELQTFPNGANDDQCDATSQALSRLFTTEMQKQRQLLPSLIGDAGTRESPWAM